MDESRVGRKQGWTKTGWTKSGSTTSSYIAGIITYAETENSRQSRFSNYGKENFCAVENKNLVVMNGKKTRSTLESFIKKNILNPS